MRRVTICKDCQDRTAGCHAECEKYIQDRKEYEAEKDRINKNKADYYRQIDVEKQRHMKRKSGKWR